jgi:uncharacterized protein YdeI (BOF family)
MKNVFLALMMAALVTPVAFANDSATTTKKTKREVKRGKGHAKVETTEKTKKMTDGTVEKSVDVEGESSNH